MNQLKRALVQNERTKLKKRLARLKKSWPSIRCRIRDPIAADCERGAEPGIVSKRRMVTFVEDAAKSS
jgi:hypothetical protein